MCEISYFPLPTAPPQERASVLASHTQPNMPHLLFSRHTHCSPTPSPMIMPLSLPHPSLTVVISVSDCTEQEWHTCMELQGSAAACQSGDREPLGVPGAAARLASCKVQPHSAARILLLARSARSEAGGARQTFMHPHTLSHRTNMYSSTVTHLHTRWHVNRHSQYTSKIAPNSEAVKMKPSYTTDSDSVFQQQKV